MGYRAISKEVKNKIMAALISGAGTVKEVANTYGVSEMTVRRMLKLHPATEIIRASKIAASEPVEGVTVINNHYEDTAEIVHSEALTDKEKAYMEQDRLDFLCARCEHLECENIRLKDQINDLKIALRYIVSAFATEKEE